MIEETTKRTALGGLRFSVRTLLLVIGVCGIALGWLFSVAHRIGHQRGIVATATAGGGSVRYNYEQSTSCGWERGTPPGPAVVRWFLGDDAFADVTHISMRAVDDSGLGRLHELPMLSSVGAKGNFTDQGLASIAKVARLESLYLDGGTITARGLEELKKCPSLRQLSFYDIDLTAVDLQPLDQLRQLERLLFVRPGQIGDVSFAPLARLASLKHIYLYQVPIGDGAFEHLGRLSSLERLELHKIPVTSAAAEHIARLQNLTFLAIEEAPQFGDSGCAQLANLKQLVELNLRVSGVTDAGMQHLATLTNLRDLNLSNTAVTDAGLHELRQLARLSHLRIGPNVTSTGIERFQRLLPKCHITVDDPTTGQKTYPAHMQ
jgi:hypothetical protein